MRRLVWIAGALVVAAAILWLFGRAPTRFVLEEECRRYHADRRAEFGELERRIARLESAADREKGAEPDPELERLRARRDELRRGHGRTRLRGWAVLLIPDSADRPAPEDFLVVGRHDPSEPGDPPTLRRGMEIWIAPRGALARLFSRLGLSP